MVNKFGVSHYAALGSALGCLVGKARPHGLHHCKLNECIRFLIVQQVIP